MSWTREYYYVLWLLWLSIYALLNDLSCYRMKRRIEELEKRK